MIMTEDRILELLKSEPEIATEMQSVRNLGLGAFLCETLARLRVMAREKR